MGFDAIEAACAFLANWAAVFNTHDPERITQHMDSGSAGTASDVDTFRRMIES